MCIVLGVTRSGYYAWLNRPESQRIKDNKVLLKHIKRIHKKSRESYGILRITAQLHKENIPCGKNRVARVMRENNIYARSRRKYKATTNSKHNYPVALNLLNQDFSVDTPNKVWIGDITYIPTDEGWLYLAGVLDLFNRKIVGWSMDKTMTTQLTKAALQQAIGRRRPSEGLIFHSDRGVQYASYECQHYLRENKIVQSMSRKGNCYDNACAESFFSTLKKDLIHGKKFKTREEAKKAIIEYIETFYNSYRLHSSLGYKSPNEYEYEYLKNVGRTA